VRPGPAANAEIANVGREGFAAERRDFVARGLKRVERHWKRPAVGDAMRALRVPLGQGLERRFFRSGPVGHRQRGDMRLNSRADFFDIRQHRPGTARAVEAHNIGALVGQPLRRLSRREAVTHLPLAVQRKGDDGRQLGSFHDVKRDFGLAEPGDGLGDDVVDARFGRPSDLLLEHRAHLPFCVCVPGFENVGVGYVASDERAAFRGDFFGDGKRGAVNRLEIAPRSIKRSFSRCA